MSRTIPLADARRELTPPPFERIAIVGCGLIGGSLSMAIKARWPSALVIAVDRKDVIETAMRMHAADVGGDDLGLAGDAQLIVLAAPVRANIEVLGRLAEFVEGAALVTDVGGTKRETLAAARRLPDRLPFIGGHPFAGAAVGGVEAARADLFEGRPWVLTSEAAAGPQTAALASLLEGIGATVRTLDGDEHDALVAYLSHLPQLVATALMHVIGERAQADGLALSGRGLRDTTRLASSPPGIWRDVLATNSDNIGRAIDDLIHALRELQAGAGTDDSFERTFESAASWKGALDSHFERTS